MKIAVFTVMLPEVSVQDAVPLLKRHGYDGVEWRVTKPDPEKSGEKPSFWGNNRCTVDPDWDEARLVRLKEETEAAGLEVPNLACYLQPGDTAGAERCMRIAQLLGSPSIRIGVPRYDRSRNYNDLWKETRDYLQKVQVLSERYGVKGLIEIHMNNIAPSAGLAYRLVDGFDPERIGIIYDPGNMVYEGYEQYRMGLELLGPYLAHVHVKNAHWVKNAEEGAGLTKPLWKAESCPVPEGIAFWPQVIADLRAVGYDGWLSFEDFSLSGTTDELLARNIAYIRSLL